MPEETENKLLNRISNLLTLADKDRNSSENEAANALRKAQLLMTESGISLADVEIFDDSEVGMGDGLEWGKSCGMDINDGSTAWEKTMAHAVSHITTTTFIIARGKRINNAGNVRNYTKFLFYGHVADTQMAAALFPIMRKMARRFARRKIGDGWDIRHRSYCQGFAKTCFERAQVEFTEEETGGQAGKFELVVRRKRTWLEEQGEKEGWSTLRSRGKRVHVGSFLMGEKDGRDVDLGVDNKIE
ncbi:hypothetical protein LCGC14_0747890 [marine sediment metagenome]|uniref:Uncharacterized protein n=1 Tax=marine sediment metagenome TaxID=412755 RepID=A0A0F9QPR4_9ZZZZ